MPKDERAERHHVIGRHDQLDLHVAVAVAVERRQGEDQALVGAEAVDTGEFAHEHVAGIVDKAVGH